MINPLTGPIVEDLAAQENKSITLKEKKKIVVNENEQLLLNVRYYGSN